MMISIVKACSAKLDGIVQTLSPGARLQLSAAKAQKLIDAGYAEATTTDADEYRAFCREIAELDPEGACWNWIQQQHPKLWHEHISSFRSGDIPRARATFQQMINTWNKKS